MVEGFTPIAGWALGQVAAPYVETWDHWIAFALLVALGGRMITAGLSSHGDQDGGAESESLWLLIVTGFATSIDAMIAGAGLAFMTSISAWPLPRSEGAPS